MRPGIILCPFDGAAILIEFECLSRNKPSIPEKLLVECTVYDILARDRFDGISHAKISSHMKYTIQARSKGIVPFIRLPFMSSAAYTTGSVWISGISIDNRNLSVSQLTSTSPSLPATMEGIFNLPGVLFWCSPSTFSKKSFTRSNVISLILLLPSPSQSSSSSRMFRLARATSKDNSSKVRSSPAVI